VERYTLLASFLLGLVYGRSSAARALPVDPQIAFIPPGEVGGGANFAEVLARELEKRGVPLGQAREAVKALLEVPEVARLVSLLEKKERALRMLRRASAAFEEGRIPPTLYSQMVRKYMAVLAGVSKELEGVDSAAVEKAVEKALALALSDKR